MVKIAPYGTWHSPIAADAMNSVSFDDLVVDPVTSVIYHVEKRPNDGGRNVLVKTDPACGIELFGKQWNCRTGIQEYGGAAARAYNGVIYFSNFSDGRVYVLKEGGQPEAVTPPSEVHRFADFAVHPIENHIVVAILEDHTKPTPADVLNTLCLINTKTSTVHPLISGADFYAAPAFSPDGNYLVWQQWQHPDMPWEGGEVHVGQVTFDSTKDSISVTGTVHVGGKHKEASAGYPFWVTSNSFVFTVDVSGFQNPWIYTVSTRKSAPILPEPVEEDFSLPAWMLGNSYGTVAHAGVDANHSTVLYAAYRDGRSRLYLLTLHSGALEELICPYVTISNVRRIADGNVVFIGSKVDEGATLVLCSIKDYSTPHFRRLSEDGDYATTDALISRAQPITLTIHPNGEPLYVLYYPPTHPEYHPPPGELPPAIINVHGGPTSSETLGLNMTIQYFTSRGFAWIGVDYGGSSGHGRAYVERLKGNWGILDTRDCVLAGQGLSSHPHNVIDPARILIRGRSSGGYTVLQSLCDYPDTFAGAASLFGISDLKKLEEFTHKFESQYMGKLLGGFSVDIPEVYEARSPVRNAFKIKRPLLIEQGSLDAVVPPEQAEGIVKQIKENGGDVEYVVFEGEGHGWRKAENIQVALEKELQFYQRILKLKETSEIP